MCSGSYVEVGSSYHTEQNKGENNETIYGRGLKTIFLKIYLQYSTFSALDAMVS